MSESTLITVSIASLVALGGVLLAAGVAWGTLRAEVRHLRGEIKALLAKLSEHGRDLDGQDMYHRERWHELARSAQGYDKRLVRIETHLGLGSPIETLGDHTPVQGVRRERVDTGRHRAAEDSG